MKLEPSPAAYEPLSLGLPALGAIPQWLSLDALVSLPGGLAGLALVLVSRHTSINTELVTLVGLEPGRHEGGGF